jgi:hypothetical protein
MKKIHLIFIIIYLVIAGISIWSMYLESLRDTWILGIVIFVGIVLSLFSHIKLFNNPIIVKGENNFLWLTLINLLLPILGIILTKQVMICGGFDLSCLIVFLGFLSISGLLWLITITMGLRSVLGNKSNPPSQGA